MNSVLQYEPYQAKKWPFIRIPGPEVVNFFSCSTQLSMKFQLLINTKIPTYKEVSSFKSLGCCIYHADKC